MQKKDDKRTIAVKASHQNEEIVAIGTKRAANTHFIAFPPNRKERCDVLLSLKRRPANGKGGKSQVTRPPVPFARKNARCLIIIT